MTDPFTYFSVGFLSNVPPYVSFDWPFSLPLSALLCRVIVFKYLCIVHHTSSKTTKRVLEYSWIGFDAMIWIRSCGVVRRPRNSIGNNLRVSERLTVYQTQELDHIHSSIFSSIETKRPYCALHLGSISTHSRFTFLVLFIGRSSLLVCPCPAYRRQPDRWSNVYCIRVLSMFSWYSQGNYICAVVKWQSGIILRASCSVIRY